MVLPPVTLTGAQVLVDDNLVREPLTLADGVIADGRGAEIDLPDCFILPGIIDLHGDAFERQVAPRPTVRFPLDQALRATDNDAAANGVTTAWMAQSWSWEGGMRGPEFTRDLLKTLQAFHPQALTDLRVQLRVETHTVETQDSLIATLAEFGVDYAIFNNHLHDARKLAMESPDQLLDWAKRASRTPQEHMAIVDAAARSQAKVPRYLCDLASAFDRLGIRFGSHDDVDAETRVYYDSIGAKICEFPTTVKAASSARALGNPVLMGAPNVVRGGSQSGNIAAVDLVRSGLCDVLVSDYHYPSLSLAAFKLVEDGVMPLVAAWRMISSKPAEIMGLSDRGELIPGKRADVIIVDAKTNRIGATISGGRLSYLSGEIGQRFIASQRVDAGAVAQSAA